MRTVANQDLRFKYKFKYRTKHLMQEDDCGGEVHAHRISKRSQPRAGCCCINSFLVSFSFFSICASSNRSSFGHFSWHSNLMDYRCFFKQDETDYLQAWRGDYLLACRGSGEKFAPEPCPYIAFEHRLVSNLFFLLFLRKPSDKPISNLIVRNRPVSKWNAAT